MKIINSEGWKHSRHHQRHRLSAKSRQAGAGQRIRKTNRPDGLSTLRPDRGEDPDRGRENTIERHARVTRENIKFMKLFFNFIVRCSKFPIMTKRKSIFLLLLWFFFFHVLSQEVSVYDLLKEIPGAEVKKITPDSLYKAAWEVMISQPLDHKHKRKGHFKQRIWVSYLDSLQPVVFVTEGYSAGRNYVSELARLTHANQIIVEHRYFGKSVPDKLDWRYLTIQQAAADHHYIYTLFKKVWPGKWISTGISKGGQTTMYFKYFYPEDADICVPYVGPLNFAVVEPRIFTFLDTVGSDSCRARIHSYQMRMLKERKKIFPLFEKYAEEMGYTWKRVGGDSAAYEYSVLEFPFAFWQWGLKCRDIPVADTSSKALFDFFKKAKIFDYFSDFGIGYFEPFFYQAMTQLGYYGYRPSRYQGEIRHVRDTTFRFAAPRHVRLKYDNRIMPEIDAFLQDQGDHFIYIYGGTDTWSATAVRLHGKANALQIFKPQGSHFTRIGNLPETQKKAVIDSLEKWLKE